MTVPTKRWDLFGKKKICKVWYIRVMDNNGIQKSDGTCGGMHGAATEDTMEVTFLGGVALLIAQVVLPGGLQVCDTCIRFEGAWRVS